MNVRDSLSNGPVNGASIGMPGTPLGTQTDAAGAGTLTPAPRPGAVLVVSANGYRVRRVRVGAGAVLRVMQSLLLAYDVTYSYNATGEWSRLH